MGAGDIATHQLEHAVGAVLEGDVEVGQQVALVGELGEGVDDLVREVGRVGVHHAKPAAPDLLGDCFVEVAQQLGQPRAELVFALDLPEPHADVVAVACGVLADHEHLERAVAHEFACFFDDAVFGLGAHLAADGWDGAEGAVLVAALGDAEVGVVARGEAEAGVVGLVVADALAVLARDGEPYGVEPLGVRARQRIGIDPVLGAVFEGLALGLDASDGFDDVLAIKHPHHRINPGRPFEHLRPVALDEAAGDHDAFDLALLFELDGFLDDAERFLLGGLEEAAGVDDDGVGGGDASAGGAEVLLRARQGQIIVLLILDDLRRNRHQPIGGQQPEHLLGVHEVLGAAEGDEGDGLDGVGFGLGIGGHWRG